MLETFFALVGAGLGLDRAGLIAASGASSALRAALLVAFCAGTSVTLGQSAVLFANRVSPRRFPLLLVGGALTYVLSLVAWGATIWLVGTYALRVQVTLDVLVFAVCVGQAPLLFGILILLPYVGTGIQRLLEAWALMVVVVALSGVLGVRFVEALVMAGGGWLLRALLDVLLSRPLGGVQLWLWRAASGRATRLRLTEALPEVAAHRAPPASGAG